MAMQHPPWKPSFIRSGPRRPEEGDIAAQGRDSAYIVVMTDPIINDQPRVLEPVHTDEDPASDGRWTERLVLFLRVMAGLSLLKGLYHWAVVCGIGIPRDAGFEAHSMSWQTATVFFAVIDLVAAVGLWLTAAWGAVVWLTAVISMIAVELLFPQVYGAGMVIVLFEAGLLVIYLWLALLAAREQPP
jgi:uncharacterized membrane protein (DUF2068 family)